MRTRGEEGASSWREIDRREGGGSGDAEFSQAAFSLLANYVFKASENFSVHTHRHTHTLFAHVVCILSCVSLCI